MVSLGSWVIGRLVKETNQIIPTDGRGRRSKIESVNLKRERMLCMQTKRSFYGATYLLDAIGSRLGITEDLKQCFPKTYKQIQSIAYYLILEDNTPLFRFEKWNQLHKHPYGSNITSQRSSELFSSITEAVKRQFFHLQGKRRLEKEYWAYDITFISSYSELLSQVQYGKNKEGDYLPQLNLALVFGEQSGLPFYYRKLAGNIPDVKTVHRLIIDLRDLGFKKVKLVMDRGFYSEENINELFKAHLKFLIAGKISLNIVRKELEPIYEGFRSYEHYSEEYELYCRTVSTIWNYKQERQNKEDTLSTSRRIYIHYYYNPEQAVEDEKALDKKLIMLRTELETNQRVESNERLYSKYFKIIKTPKRGINVTVKEEAVAQAKRYLGFFVLLTNETMDAITALELYRNKDLVEKAFGNLKERLNMRRMLVSSEQSLEGKLFVQFVALIYLSYIKNQMQKTDLFKKYTLQEVLDQLDLIECFELPGRRLSVGEILEKQREIYNKLGVTPPTSL